MAPSRRVPFSLHAPPAEGYWTGFLGAPPSTVEWCEANYAICSFIAEFFNTISSLAILGVGIIGILATRRLERRFFLAYATIALVGLGSIAFHMTLLRPMQALDEVPMLFAAMVMCYCILENDSLRPRYGRKLPLALTAHAVLVTGLTTLTSGKLQFALFHLSFGSLEVFSLVAVALQARRETDSSVRRLYAWGFAAYGAALVCWFCDTAFCDYLSRMRPANPQLHAWWHVLVSCGLYLLTVCSTHRRMRVLAAAGGGHAAIEWRGGVLPVARLVKGAK